MAPLDLSKILENYEGKWVALSEDDKSVLGSGGSAKSALDNAKSNGYLDVTLMFVQPKNLFYCGTVKVTS